ncbi:hypothetical protein Hanom_Chr06g00515801 [Helianthus anomalus]
MANLHFNNNYIFNFCKRCSSTVPSGETVLFIQIPLSSPSHSTKHRTGSSVHQSTIGIRIRPSSPEKREHITKNSSNSTTSSPISSRSPHNPPPPVTRYTVHFRVHNWNLSPPGKPSYCKSTVRTRVSNIKPREDAIRMIDVLTRHLTSVISDIERFYANGTLQFIADVYIRDLNHRHRFNRCFRRR